MYELSENNIPDSELTDHERTGKTTLAVFSKENKAIVSLFNLPERSVIDAVSYDNIIYAPLDNSTILKFDPEKHSQHIIRSDRQISRIFDFGGYIYAVSDETLYQLEQRTYETNSWKWTLMKWAPKNITDVSPTLLGEHIYITTSNNVGYLYESTSESSPKLLFKRSIEYKRVYGLDNNAYLDIDVAAQTAIQYPDNEEIENIVNGALTHDNDVVRIDERLANKVIKVRILNWEPYFIIQE